MEYDFENGDCPIFAIALHRLSGLPLRGIVEFDEALEATVLIHAFVRLNADTIVDSTGMTSTGAVLDKYPNWGNGEEVEFLEEELLSLGYARRPPPLAPALQAARDVLRRIATEGKN